MSRLQDFITKLGLVIIKYTEKQTSQVYNDEEILASPHDQLIEELTNLIQKTAKETRHTFLNYIMYVINTINPLVEKKLPLTEDQELFIKEILNNFLESLFELVNISSSTEVQLKYNNIETIAPRFISKGWTGGRVLSEMGELVTKYLLNSITAKREREIALYVDIKLIQEHQSIVFKPILETKIKELQELIEQLQHQLETQKNSSQLQKTTELLAHLEKQHNEAALTNSGLQKVLIQLQKQHEIQGNELQELKIQLNTAQAKYHDAKQSIDKLKQENEYFQQQLKISQTESRETKEQLTFSQEQYSKLEQIIVKLQKDNSHLQHQLEAKQTELQETKQQLIISQESNLKSENAVATLQEENRQLKSTRTTTPSILMPSLMLGSGRSSFPSFFPNNRILERSNNAGSQNNDPSVGSSSLNPGNSGTIE